MTFGEFIYEQGIMGVTIGTITGFAISNFIKDINTQIIFKLLQRFKISNAGLLSSLIEFIILMLIVYLIYIIVLFPIFKQHIKEEKQEEQKHIEWKNDILHEVKHIDMGTVYL